MDWKRELVIAHLVKQKIAGVDLERLWENTLPEVAASPDQIESIETRLGWTLCSRHREFLLQANGWRSFMQHIDVFSVDDFGGPRAARAMTLIDSLEPLESLCGFGKQDLLPIAVSSDDIDVVLTAAFCKILAGISLAFDVIGAPQKAWLSFSQVL